MSADMKIKIWNHYLSHLIVITNSDEYSSPAPAIQEPETYEITYWDETNNIARIPANTKYVRL